MMIEVDHEYHIVELWKSAPNEVLEWCLDKFGVPGTRWWTAHNKIYFYHSKDHLMFIIRWSS